MTERQYPYDAWVLLTSLKPKKVTFVKPDENYTWCRWQITDKNRRYAPDTIYPSKFDAINAGREKLITQQAKLDKGLLNIQKRRETLNKALEELRRGDAWGKK